MWGLTQEGRDTHLSPDTTWELYVRIRDAHRSGASKNDAESPAPDADSDEGISCWFAGAVWNKTEDQLPRSLAEGIRENGYADKYSELVRRMKPGDRIAVKASSVKKQGLLFDFGGKPVSVMRIFATGTILENLNDPLLVRVA